MKNTTPQYKEDILEMLRHQNCVPAMFLTIGAYWDGLKQAVSRAADEIERLRKENEKLRKGL